jgi:hypothetical protein
VALQGTLDTFSLPDVLRLLATTGKSGCLHIDGDRGRGSVWIDDGAVVAAEADRALNEAAVDEVVFEMLRFDRGSFNFAADEQAKAPAEPVDVEGTLRRASQLLDEWRELEAVVPSLSHRVAMAPELTVEQVTIDASRWEALVAIAGGRSVGELAETLGQGELGISRMVSDLVELGVAVIEAPGAARVGSTRRSLGSDTPAPARTTSPDLPRRSRADQNGSGRRESSPSMPLSDGLTSGINWAQSAEAGTLKDPTGEHGLVGRPSGQVGGGRTPAGANQYNETGTNGTNGRSMATPATGVGVATPAGGNHLEIPPKTPRRSGGSSRSTRARRTGPTPATQAPTTPPLPTRNGQALVKPPLPSPAYPTTDMGERERPATNGRARSVGAPSPMPTTPPELGRGATIPVPPPESTRGPLLSPSLDTGRLGPSPMPTDTGQIPAVSASSLPPDLSWAAEDEQAAMAPPPLSSPFAGLGPAAPASGPGSAPGRLLQSQPTRPPAQMAMPPAAPQMPAPMPTPLPTPTNGRQEGDPALHVVAMSPDARAAVEASVGRSGGGPGGGLQMSGVSPEQMMGRGHLLSFLSSVHA